MKNLNENFVKIEAIQVNFNNLKTDVANLQCDIAVFPRVISDIADIKTKMNISHNIDSVDR